jgi:hypothetical protein
VVTKFDRAPTLALPRFIIASRFQCRVCLLCAKNVHVPVKKTTMIFSRLFFSMVFRVLLLPLLFL